MTPIHDYSYVHSIRYQDVLLLTGLINVVSILDPREVMHELEALTMASCMARIDIACSANTYMYTSYVPQVGGGKNCVV